MIDTLFFFSLSIGVLYLSIFSFASLKRVSPPNSRTIVGEPKIVVLFPAYREDGVIEFSVASFLEQNYPKKLYEVVVISDSMLDKTNKILSNLPITLLVAPTPLKNKGNALKYALDKLGEREFNMAIVLDADNTVEPNFLNDISLSYCGGAAAIQVHRKAKNSESPYAILDGISEEINNSIFRLGHSNLGLSATLSGSGMAFDYTLFKKLVPHLKSAGEDKELELLLLQEGVKVEYLNNTPLYDQKIASSGSFYNQRRRWIASQLNALKEGWKLLPKALKERNIDLSNKIFHHLLLPKVLLFGLLLLFATATLAISPLCSIKWWLATALFVVAMVVATPREMLNREAVKSFVKLPAIFLMMLFNLFRSRGAVEHFIHTKKGEV